MKVRLASACVAAAAWLPQAALAQEEVPFITTPDAVTLAMLQLAKVGANDHVIDLGSGDGRIVITAAKRFGASGLGVEIVPDLVLKSREAAKRAGVAERVSFMEQDLFTTDLRRASVITMYLLPEVNLQLRPRLLELPAGTRIVSHDWTLGDWQPDAELDLVVPEKAIGREKKSKVMLWIVPARLSGLWCHKASGTSATGMQVPMQGQTQVQMVSQLRIEQQFSRAALQLHLAVPVQADAKPPSAPWVADARITGSSMAAQVPMQGRWELQSDGRLLQHGAGSVAATFNGGHWQRANALGADGQPRCL